MAVLMSQVLTTARTYLNDDNATQNPDNTLIPKLQEAHRELQEELWVVGSPLVRARSNPITLVAGTIVLSPTTTPPLPADLLCPTSLYESPNGAFNWTPMTEAFYVPLGYIQLATLGWWSWRAEQIQFGGATGTVYVVIDYRRQIPIPALVTDPIGILFGESFLAARTAAIASGVLGNAEAFAAMTSLAKENLAKVLSANRGKQTSTIKP